MTCENERTLFFGLKPEFLHVGRRYSDSCTYFNIILFLFRQSEHKNEDALVPFALADPLINLTTIICVLFTNSSALASLFEIKNNSADTTCLGLQLTYTKDK